MPGRLDQIESMLKARLGSALLASCPELVYSVSGILFRFLRTSDSLSALWRQLDSTLFNTVFQATGGRMRVTLDDGRSILATAKCCAIWRIGCWRWPIAAWTSARR